MEAASESGLFFSRSPTSQCLKRASGGVLDDSGMSMSVRLRKPRASRVEQGPTFRRACSMSATTTMSAALPTGLPRISARSISWSTMLAQSGPRHCLKSLPSNGRGCYAPTCMAFYCTVEMVRRFLASKRSGKIINVTAPSAVRASSGVADYASAKGGIIAFTKNAAKELAPTRLTSAVPIGSTPSRHLEPSSAPRALGEFGFPPLLNCRKQGHFPKKQGGYCAKTGNYHEGIRDLGNFFKNK